MNTKKVIGMLLLVVFCAVYFPGHAQQIVPLTFNVLVKVSCSDETTKVLIESYIFRELRNLGDVIVDSVDSPSVPYTHAIWAIVGEPERLGMGKTGLVIISATFTEFIAPILKITPILEAHVSHDTRVAIANDILDKDELFSISAYRQGFLAYSERVGIQTSCKNIVAAFDRTALQITRNRR